MEQIKDTILELMQKWDAKKDQLYGGNPEEVLKKILTKKELGHIKVNYFRKGVLGVNVDSSTWHYSLSLRKEELLEKIKKELGAVKDIRFRIGEI